MPKRTFTKERKLEIIREACEPGATFSAIASKYELQPSQLHDWHKQYLGSRKVSSIKESKLTLATELCSDVESIKLLQKYLVGSGDSILSKLYKSRVGAYNLANAARAITSAFIDLQCRKTELLERLTMDNAPQQELLMVDPDRTLLAAPAVRRIGEMASIEIIKQYMLEGKLAIGDSRGANGNSTSST